MVRRAYKWFIAPLNSHTNEVISRMLPEENMSLDVKCKHGIEPCLWECEQKIVRYLMASRKSLNIAFKIFNKEGNGKIRDVTNLYIRGWCKKTPAAKTAAVTAV